VIALRLGRLLVLGACPALVAGCAFAAKAHLPALVLGCACGSVLALFLGLGLCVAGGGSMGERAAEPYEQLLPSLVDLPCGGCGQCEDCDLRLADV